jgi:hypothetical protein
VLYEVCVGLLSSRKEKGSIKDKFIFISLSFGG